MIRISCTNCKTVLSIDDAFAGGVCRCQHCGTIQTVPAHARDTAAVGASGQTIGSSKSLYQQGDGRSSELEDLAGAVMSSGLTSGRLKRPDPSLAAKSPNLMPIIAIGGIVIALLVVIIIFMASRGGGSNQTSTSGGLAPPANSSAGANPTVITKGPNFCGAKLPGSTVIYLLDCGQSSGDYLGELKDVTIKSTKSLGSDRKFEILFWNKDGTGSYPEGTTTYATDDNIAAAQKAMEAAYPFGQSDITDALTKAMAQHPDDIVIATGKGWQLANDWLDSILAARGSFPTRFHTFNIDIGGNSGESAVLKQLADKTGGSYRTLNKGDLDQFAQ